MIKKNNHYTAKMLRKQMRMNIGSTKDPIYRLAWAVKSVMQVRSMGLIWDWDKPDSEVKEYPEDKWIEPSFDIENTALQIAANLTATNILYLKDICDAVWETYLDHESYQFFMPSTRELCLAFKAKGIKHINNLKYRVSKRK